MKKLTKFALRIFLYGFSPVLMSGSELPGSTGTKSVFNDLEDIWVPLSIADFSTSAKKFKDLKKIAQDTGEIKDWENVVIAKFINYWGK